MRWHRSLFPIFVTILLAPRCDAKPRPKQEVSHRPVLFEQYGHRFEAFHPPAAEIVRQRGCRVRLSKEEADNWSRSALIVMMQKGPVVYLSTSDNLLVAPPFVVLLEVREQEVSLYAYFMRELYQDAANPSLHVFPIDSQQAKTLSDLLLQEVLTQIRASLKNADSRRDGTH